MARLRAGLARPHPRRDTGSLSAKSSSRCTTSRKADVILSLEADFLAWGPGRLKDARAFASRRDAGAGGPEATMNRLYVAERTPSLTGALADHRLADRRADVALLARALAAAIKPGDAPTADDLIVPNGLAAHAGWIKALVRDLKANRGKSLLIAGDTQPANVHALAHAINHALGNIGKTVQFSRVRPARPTRTARFASWPATSRPAQSRRSSSWVATPPMTRLPSLISHVCWPRKKPGCEFTWGSTTMRRPGSATGTSRRPTPLESWSDLRAFDGTATIQQPLIAPLYKGRSAHELLALFLGQPDLTPLEIVRDYWKRQRLAGRF